MLCLSPVFITKLLKLINAVEPVVDSLVLLFDESDYESETVRDDSSDSLTSDPFPTDSPRSHHCT